MSSIDWRKRYHEENARVASMMDWLHERESQQPTGVVHCGFKCYTSIKAAARMIEPKASETDIRWRVMAKHTKRWFYVPLSELWRYKVLYDADKPPTVAYMVAGKLFLDVASAETWLRQNDPDVFGGNKIHADNVYTRMRDKQYADWYKVTALHCGTPWAKEASDVNADDV